MPPQPTARVLLVVFASVALSATAVLMIKASTVPPALLASLRMLGAALVLWPLRRIEQRRAPQPLWPSLRPSLLPGVFLGLHFIAWNLGARATQAGNATLVVSLGPLVMPLAAWFFFREHPSRREIVGTMFALCGLIVLGWQDYHFSADHWIGDLLCLLAMVLWVLYISLARNRVKPGALFSYLVPLYGAGGLVCLAWSLATELPYAVPSLADVAFVVGLVLGPTVLGHSIANWAMTKLRAQTFSLLNLGQFAFAGVFAYFAFGEVPGAAFLVTAALVVAGALVALLPKR